MEWSPFAHQVVRSPGIQWFCESLGELASLFTLRSMSVTWEVSPPYPNWRSYAAQIRIYAQDLLERKSPSIHDGKVSNCIEMDACGGSMDLDLA